MKTYKQLYPLITDFENLWLAFKAAARGTPGGPPMHRVGCEQQSLSGKAEIASSQKALLAMTVDSLYR
ncbi:MAG: hypothetical protein HY870_03665 [Chloroflexi bacterium]|nr:hypothetical protein [Chloroflexota bacterium]